MSRTLGNGRRSRPKMHLVHILLPLNDNKEGAPQETVPRRAGRAGREVRGSDRTHPCAGRGAAEGGFGAGREGRDRHLRGDGVGVGRGVGREVPEAARKAVQTGEGDCAGAGDHHDRRRRRRDRGRCRRISARSLSRRVDEKAVNNRGEVSGTIKVVIVTGGSRGIGTATCKLAAERGYAVCVNYRANREAAEHVVAEYRKAGTKAIAVQADVAVEADVVRLFETVDRELGRVTALVNNAGSRRRSRQPSCGSCPTRRPTPPVRSSTSPAGDDSRRVSKPADNDEPAPTRKVGCPN